MKLSIFIPYLIVMAGVTYAIRAIPFLLMQKKIKNRYINAFLEYIPYSVLTAMTVPAIFYATSSPISSAAGFVAAISAALHTKNLLLVALTACAGVAAAELILSLI